MSSENTGGEQVLHPGLHMHFSSAVRPSLGQQGTCSTSDFEERSTPQQIDPAVLAMIGPPLDSSLISSPPLATPVYSGLWPLEDNQYFPYFSVGWEDSLLELGTS